MTEFKSEPPPPWRTPPTEGRHPASEALDTLPVEDVVGLVLEEDRRGLEAALAQRGVIARAARWVAETLESGGDVVMAGAGTSGRLGVLEAAECPPTFGTDPDRIRAVIAGGADAVFRAKEGAEDSAQDGREAVRGLGARDLLIGISASSLTPYVHGALRAAGGRGARTVLLTCAPADDIPDVADLVVALATGPEILTGSTRLKAGSATKAVLNAITTAAMARNHKVFGNLMVDLRPGSAKLRDRCVRIVEDAGRVSRRDAERLLAGAGGEVKVAIVMARRRCSAETAGERLQAASGNVRQVLGEPV